MADAPAVACKNVGFSYSSTPAALDSVTFELQRGVMGLVGVNGAGKSTLLSILAGAAMPDSGEARIFGATAKGRERREYLNHVSLMPQHLQFPGSLSAEQAVAMVAFMRGLSPSSARRAAIESLDRVGLASRRGSRVNSLSGGMQRRLALAQALTSSPRVLLLDEPSTGLDPEQRRAIVDLIRDLDGTVIVSSHILEDVEAVAERVVVLHEGRVKFDGLTASLADLAPSDSPQARRLEMGFLSVIVNGHEVS